MRSILDQRSNATDLLRAAESAAIPFESSPTGRWVRFQVLGESVYVVRDAWDAGGIVMSTGADGPVEVDRFADIREAVAMAVRLARGDLAGAFTPFAARRAG